MSFFDSYYNESIAKDRYAMNPSDIIVTENKKEQTRGWVKKCLEDGLEANKKILVDLQNKLLKQRVQLANGDDSVIVKIMETRFLLEEIIRQTPFIEEEMKLMFEQE
jgi:hypothetical protein